MAYSGGCFARRRRVSAGGCVELQKPARIVPTWEKRFCWEVGCIPWNRVKNAIRFIDDAQPVNQWNNSAGEKALKRAMLQYWLKINGLPCKIRLPSPDLYIDKIDWDPNNNCIEPELLQCLDEAPADKEEEEQKGMKSFDVTLDQIKPTGWDCDDREVFGLRNSFLTGMVVGE